MTTTRTTFIESAKLVESDLTTYNLRDIRRLPRKDHLAGHITTLDGPPVSVHVEFRIVQGNTIAEVIVTIKGRSFMETLAVPAVGAFLAGIRSTVAAVVR